LHKVEKSVYAPILLWFFYLESLAKSEPEHMIKREYPESPLVGVGAIIIENGRVLLVKRGHAPLVGEWSIPGGVLEVGETVREAAVREALEETSLTVEPAELLGVYDRLLRDDDGRTLYHYVLIDFRCHRIAGELQAAGDADEVRWFSQEEVAKLPLAEDTAEVIRLGFEKGC
jgi:8-oxo-dGTP diphosphatase